MQYVSGTQKVINNLMLKKFKFLGKIGEAVEKTAVDIANHAKKGHVGNMAHANKRYQNRTTNLTQSIEPGLEKISLDEVTGFVAATKDYALPVEMRYPFMFPALAANKDNFKDKCKDAIS